MSLPRRVSELSRLRAAAGTSRQAPGRRLRRLHRQAKDDEGKSTKPSRAKLTTVTLDETKYSVAKIKLDEARVDHIPTGVSVVGQIQANSDRQVEVRPWATGIIREVQARLGQKVKRGDPLVILDSPEIGTARLNLRSKQRELSTARFEARWKSDIATNVALLDPRAEKRNQRAPQCRVG